MLDLDYVGNESILFNRFKSYVIKSHPIGSRYVCDPPVLDTDKDTLILVTDTKAACQILLELGWTYCLNGEYFEGFFMALRKGEDNYILTAHEMFFDRYVVAAEVAKRLNVKDKQTRIAIHEACIGASGGIIGLVEW